ncbi:hypothetical protein KKF84_11080 [Myxococcota bacterium]|nr:hypothetical protein [Myxococcota bacterium]MBU1535854.1 hypothetical protein [Myxococcota bacterium]
MFKRILSSIAVIALFASCGEKTKGTSPDKNNKADTAEKKIEKKGPEVSTSNKKAGKKVCLSCRAGKLKWTQITTMPADLLEKITDVGGQTNALFKGQEARMSVSCIKDKTITCSVKSGKISDDLTAKLVSALSEKLFDTTADGMVDLLCEKVSGKWSCRYSLVPIEKK